MVETRFKEQTRVLGEESGDAPSLAFLLGGRWRYFVLLFALLGAPEFFSHFFNPQLTPGTAVQGLFSLLLLSLAFAWLTLSFGTSTTGLLVSRTFLSLLAIYYFAQFVSFYLQGTAVNQQFFFHLDLSTLVLTWRGFAALFFVFIAWFISIHFLATPLQAATKRPFASGAAATLFILLGVATNPAVSWQRLSGTDPIDIDTRRFVSTLPADELGLNPTALTPFIEHPAAGKNLLLIYLEGLELSFTNPDRFPDLTPTLSALTEAGTHFRNMQQIAGSEWTVGGIVSSLCGTPLLYEGLQNGNMILSTGFLNSAVCLPDILRGAGYHQVFMGGASLSFAGKGHFLEQHGYDDRYGFEELRPALGDAYDRAAWGLFDEDLFALATEEFAKLGDAGQPFHLTLLTVDTHPPEGEPSPSCPDYPHSDSLMLRAVHCTDRLLGQFLDRISVHPAYADTVVALVSDHLSMRSAITDSFPPGQPRHLYFTLLNTPEAVLRADAQLSPLDIAPSLLDALEIDTEWKFLAGHSVFDLDSASLPQIDIHSPRRIQYLRYINERFYSSRSGSYVYGLIESGPESLQGEQQIQAWSRREGRLLFQSTGDDPFFILPPIDSRDRERASLTVSIEVEQATEFQVFFRSREEDGYAERRSIRHTLEPGINEFTLTLDAETLEQGLRIDPGQTLGEYRIGVLEIRS